MSKLLKVGVNDEVFSAKCGDLLLDAALMNGINIPHDCRSGYCDTCRVRVLDGWVLGGQTNDPEIVRACQGRVVSDLKLAIEDVPEVTTSTGRVVNLLALAPNVVEVRIKLSRPLHCLPGQYCNVGFRGFPSRCYSPTAPLDGRRDDHWVHLHVRVLKNGHVSSALGRTILTGHRLKLTGPLGSAYLRPLRSERLVLVAGGTGFAPLWAIAEAAMRERPARKLVFVVGARSLDSLYMIPALCRLARFPNTTIIPVVADPQFVSSIVREGRPTDHLPTLSWGDVVYAAGAPAMVESVAAIARAAAAKCYSDPFGKQSEPGRAERPGLLSRTVDWFSREVQIPPPSQLAPKLQRQRRNRWEAALVAGGASPHDTPV